MLRILALVRTEVSILKVHIVGELEWTLTVASTLLVTANIIENQLNATRNYKSYVQFPIYNSNCIRNY
jgi:hypothetical protein